MKYCVIMTAYNEEKNLQKSLPSILSQTIKPEKIIVANDGSTDNTEEILKSYPVEYFNVEDPKFKISSYNMVRALNRAYSKLKNIEFDYLLKIDADSQIPPDYMKKLMHIMEKNPKLGIVSGAIKDGAKIYSHRCSDGARVYRNECYKEIGGLDFIVHWDTHAMIKAYEKGWLVRTIQEIKYIELRTHDRQSWRHWYISGIARADHGFPLYHTFLVAMIRLRDPPPLGSIVMLLTYLIFLNRFKVGYTQEFAAMELKQRFRLFIKQ